MDKNKKIENFVLEEKKTRERIGEENWKSDEQKRKMKKKNRKGLGTHFLQRKSRYIIV